MVRTAALTLLGWALLCAQAGAAPPPAQILAETPRIEHFQLDEPVPGDGFRLRRGRLSQPDPYGGQPLQTGFDLYLAATRDAAPLVLVLTPYRGVTFADRGYAESLARSGIHAAVVAVPKDAYRQDADIGYIDRFFVRHTINVRDLREALSHHPDSPIRVSRSAILGTSLGAIRASILFGSDRELRAAVLIMPGGDLATLIARTVLEPIARWRDKFLFPELRDEPFALPEPPTEADLRAFEQRLRPHVHIDPLDFIRPGGAADVLMVRSEADTFVPRPNQDALFSAYRRHGGAPLEIAGSGFGHYATVLAVYNDERARIVEFLQDRLGR